jgi:hypothetical protein
MGSARTGAGAGDAEMLVAARKQVARRPGSAWLSRQSPSRAPRPGYLFGIAPLNSEPCTWCGDDVGPDDGFRAYELAGGRRAVFCRLEHIIPWVIQGSHWGAAGLSESAGTETPPSGCSHCVAQLGEGHVLLVRHRGAHRIADGFCSVTHMRDWAKAGGRWR